VIRALFLALAGLAELSFEPWFVERSVAVEIARLPGQAPWIRATGELPAPADVLEADGANTRIHFVWPYPFPFRRRDAVVAYRSERLPGGAYLVSWQDAARLGDPKEGIRIPRVAGETRIEPLDAGRCRVTYAYLGDLGGKFPRAAAEKAWRHEPLGYFYALRRRLGLPIPAK